MAPTDSSGNAVTDFASVHYAPAGAAKGGCNTRKNRRQNGGGVTIGTKRQVWNGTAKHTTGGLKRTDLMKHKGKIVSRKKHAQGLRAIKVLRKKGYVAKKGTFKLFKKHSK